VTAVDSFMKLQTSKGNQFTCCVGVHSSATSITKPNVCAVFRIRAIKKYEYQKILFCAKKRSNLVIETETERLEVEEHLLFPSLYMAFRSNSRLANSNTTRYGSH